MNSRNTKKLFMDKKHEVYIVSVSDNFLNYQDCFCPFNLKLVAQQSHWNF
uniref:Uncharacterized protein n=1 Tax=Rhizophora mucronata TaxID=61149 RepID=A0A2P2PI94_RHIMU